jgi:hypothetical protein
MILFSHFSVFTIAFLVAMVGAALLASIRKLHEDFVYND